MPDITIERQSIPKQKTGLPSFLGIGAARCGTTWLDTVLRSHPDLYLPERRKEIHFFNLYYDRGLDWYQDFFPSEGSNRTMGEITPDYLYFPETPGRIHQHFPDCKFLTILRNPADRAYSHYGFLIRELDESRSFEAVMEQEPEVFDRGLYAAQLKRYLKFFPIENFLILVFEEVMSDRDRALTQIANFLDINADKFAPDNLKGKVNASRRSRFPQARRLVRNLRDELRNKDLDWIWNMAKRSGLERLFESQQPLPKVSPAYRKALLSQYQADISSLQKLLNKDLSFWQ